MSWNYCSSCGTGKLKCSKFVPVHGMKTLEYRRYSSSFLTSLVDGGECSTSASAALPPWGGEQCPLNRRLGGPQSQSGYFGEDKNILILPGTEP